jgi:hypothetical protein|tara:strand:- start:125 stop:310 length:186 start_codon:yes stop_codon:yes gene_type:complete
MNDKKTIQKALDFIKESGDLFYKERHDFFENSDKDKVEILAEKYMKNHKEQIIRLKQILES